MFEKVDTSTPLGRVQMFRLRQSVNRYEISILTTYFMHTVHSNLATPFLSVLCNKEFFFSPAISQRDPSACYHYLSAHKETIRHEVASFFQKNIAGKFPNKNCELCFINYMQTASECFFSICLFFSLTDVFDVYRIKEVIFIIIFLLWTNWKYIVLFVL